jgi:hypothetical protein
MHPIRFQANHRARYYVRVSADSPSPPLRFHPVLRTGSEAEAVLNGSIKSLISLKDFGAGEEIRTLDPNLGKAKACPVPGNMAGFYTTALYFPTSQLQPFHLSVTFGFNCQEIECAAARRASRDC